MPKTDLAKGSPRRRTVRIGVFLPGQAQLLDTACIDVFAMMSHEYLAQLGDLFPATPSALAPDVEILYIGTAQPGEPLALTAGMRILCTHHMADPAIGALDVVLVPGQDPAVRWRGEIPEWLARQAAAPGTDVLSVCTGIFLCGEAGLLKGRRACGPRGLQGLIKERFEGVELVGDKLRWVQDGNLWSSGGVTNGNDLVAAYARQSQHFPGPVAEIALKLADVGDRPQRFDNGQVAFTIGVAWQLLKAWLMGFGKAKTV